jgi:hypothetical protein
MKANDINIKMINHCVLGDLKGIKECLKQGADLGFRGDEVFYIACTKGFTDIAKFCLKEGRGLCQECFQMAAQEGHHEIVKLFVKSGIDVKSDNSCAFRWACANGHLLDARYLYKNGCNVFELEGYDFRYSAANGHLDVVKFLLSLNPAGDWILEAYNNAKDNGHKKVAALLERSLRNKGMGDFC